MKILASFFIILFTISKVSFSQDVDCSQQLSNEIEKPWNFNSLSKSNSCETGKKYEYVIPLSKGMVYRLLFSASAVFNRNINFKIVDQNTGKTYLDLPGQSKSGAPWSSVLVDIYDEARDRIIHPFFELMPSTATTIKIILDVKPLDEVIGGGNGPVSRSSGCITVMVLNKPVKTDF